MQHHNPHSHPHGNATHSSLRLRDSHDAHILFQAVRQGHLPLIRKRLTGPEQQALHAGQVFVWADREGSLERWTDGHNWSPSRVRGPFLMYDEMPEDTDAFLRRKAQQKAGERRVKQPRKKRLPPLPGGLSKQTYSATLIQNGLEIQKWHLTAYFKDDGNADGLITPDEDPLLRTIIVPENTFKSSMSRKSKSSSSRARRGSLSEHRSVTTADDDHEHDHLRDSPIDEHSPVQMFSSPPQAPFDMATNMPLPWETHFHAGAQQLRSFGSGQEEGNGSGGSSNGSTHTERGYFTAAGAAYQGNNFSRGRPMHLEGIHTRFDTVGGPAFGLSALSPPSAAEYVSSAPPAPQRSLSLSSGLPTTDSWRSFDTGAVPSALDERRGSLISIDSSRSASSSTSSKLPGLSSNSSSPASSSWSQQSPYLAPTAWPAAAQGPAGKYAPTTSPLVPASLPSSGRLPSHIQHHPEMVQSAVPPASIPNRRATLPPLLYQGDNSAHWNASAGLYYTPTSTTTTTPPFLPSPFDVPAPASYFSDKMHQPRAAVPPAGVPGSWEQANAAGATISFDFAAGGESLNSPMGGAAVGGKEVFESVVPGHVPEYASAGWP